MENGMDGVVAGTGESSTGYHGDSADDQSVLES
jgi:hypothetical protein